jgi:hypothetical protein
MCDLKDARANGFVYCAAHFNSVDRYLVAPQHTEALKSLVTLSSPLKTIEIGFTVDSSSFGTLRFVRWFNKRHGKEVGNREWVKENLMCGPKTQVVTALSISGWRQTALRTSSYWSKELPSTLGSKGFRRISRTSTTSTYGPSRSPAGGPLSPATEAKLTHTAVRAG